MQLLDMPDPEMAESIATWQEGFTWLRRPEIVTVASVRGSAVGAGFQLALACDLRVLSETARFSMREPLLGLVPDLTGTKPLVDLVGYSRALEICATTRWVGADEARDIGLATAVVPDDELDGTVADLVAALTAPIYGAVSADQGTAAERVAPRPRGAAARRARGTGTPLPRARLADGRVTRPHRHGRPQSRRGRCADVHGTRHGAGVAAHAHRPQHRRAEAPRRHRPAGARVRPAAPPADRRLPRASRSSTPPSSSSRRCWSRGSSTTAS